MRGAVTISKQPSPSDNASLLGLLLLPRPAATVRFTPAYAFPALTSNSYGFAVRAVFS